MPSSMLKILATVREEFFARYCRCSKASGLPGGRILIKGYPAPGSMDKKSKKKKKKNNQFIC
jgi:hypothetical protein